MTEKEDGEKQRLWHQIREACGRAIYTYETLNAKANRVETWAFRLKLFQIILSSASAVGLLVAVLRVFDCNQETVLAVTTLISFASLALNLYFREFQRADDVLRTKQAIHELWNIREDYYSLMVDFDCLSPTIIRIRRDQLQARVFRIYQQAPRTEEKDYRKARKKLKIDHEQTFSEEELDDLMPKWSRATK